MFPLTDINLEFLVKFSFDFVLNLLQSLRGSCEKITDPTPTLTTAIYHDLSAAID